MTRRTRLWSLLATVVCAAAATLGALAAPASGATQNAAADGPQSHNRVFDMQTTLHKVTATRGGNTLVAPSRVGAVKNQSASQMYQGCPISAFGYSGSVACDSSALFTINPNGLEEVFVIGTDGAIWHAWPGSNGWHSLGGVAGNFIGNGIRLVSFDPFTIQVRGTTGSYYCNKWAWSGWTVCPAQF